MDYSAGRGQIYGFWSDFEHLYGLARNLDAVRQVENDFGAPMVNRLTDKLVDVNNPVLDWSFFCASCQIERPMANIILPSVLENGVSVFGLRETVPSAAITMATVTERCNLAISASGG